MSRARDRSIFFSRVPREWQFEVAPEGPLRFLEPGQHLRPLKVYRANKSVQESEFSIWQEEVRY